MFYGPTSVGKTHLLEGIWTAARRSHQRLTAVYLSAEQFTSHFLEALRGSGLPSFRRKYRGVGLLMIDDLQFFVGKRATQVELLHTIDTFLREGRQLVFAADRSPAELAELGPELTTRLSSGLVCRIEPPDYATRLGIVAPNGPADETPRADRRAAVRGVAADQPRPRTFRRLMPLEGHGRGRRAGRSRSPWPRRLWPI